MLILALWAVLAAAVILAFFAGTRLHDSLTDTDTDLGSR